MITHQITYVRIQTKCLDNHVDYDEMVQNSMSGVDNSTIIIDISNSESITATGEMLLIRALKRIIDDRQYIITNVIILHHKCVMGTMHSIGLMCNRVIGSTYDKVKLTLTSSYEGAIKAITQEEMTRVR